MARSGQAFLSLDELQVERAGDRLRLRAQKTVADGDSYLAGHFPGFTVFPGVFVLECLRQSVAAAIGRPGAEVRSLRSMFLLAPLLAGERMELVAAVQPAERGWLVEAEVKRRDGVVAARIKAELGDA
jgi:3-hydroxyacyl-[acyl-carrier-protein] dehydratase